MIGNIVFFWWVFDSNYVMAFLAAAPFIIILLLATPRFHEQGSSKDLLSEATEQGHEYGLVYYAVSWTILALFLFNDLLVASLAIVAMSYGDGVGGLIGKKYGKRMIRKGKSIEGTTAVALGMFIASMVVIGFYGWIGPAYPHLDVKEISLTTALGVAVLSGAFVSLVELFSPGKYDNLIVPLLTAGMLLVLGL